MIKPLTTGLWLALLVLNVKCAAQRQLNQAAEMYQLADQIQLQLSRVLLNYQQEFQLSDRQAELIYRNVMQLLQEMVELSTAAHSGHDISLDGVVGSAGKLMHSATAAPPDNAEQTEISVETFLSRLRWLIDSQLTASASSADNDDEDERRQRRRQLNVAAHQFIVGLRQAHRVASQKSNSDTSVMTDEIDSAVINMASALLQTLRALDVHVVMPDSAANIEKTMFWAERVTTSLVEVLSPLFGMDQQNVTQMQRNLHTLIDHVRELSEGSTDMDTGLESLVNDAINLIEYFAPHEHNSVSAKSQAGSLVRLERAVRRLVMKYGPTDLSVMIGSESRKIPPSEALNIGYKMMLSAISKLYDLVEHPDEIIQRVEQVKTFVNKYVPVLGRRLDMDDEVVVILTTHLEKILVDIESVVARDVNILSGLETLMTDFLQMFDALGIRAGFRDENEAYFLNRLLDVLESTLMRLMTNMAPYLNMNNADIGHTRRGIEQLRGHMKALVERRTDPYSTIVNFIIDTVKIMNHFLRTASER